MFFRQRAAANASLSHLFGCAGHRAGGACGAGLSGKPASTIGFEKRFNPMHSMSREAFMRRRIADIPAPPADMARFLEAKLRGPARD
ncbi:hypothetical protein [Caldimonas sp. KR1-144]|uniref:hypothetical protein n=1 Tax=Caldimonas sp. KR1-144 TaxID=3400911 RepID=UPI003C118FA7